MLISHVIKNTSLTCHFQALMGRLIIYIIATSYLRRGRRDVKLRDQDVLRKFFAELVITQTLILLYSQKKHNE